MKGRAVLAPLPVGLCESSACSPPCMGPVRQQGLKPAWHHCLLSPIGWWLGTVQRGLGRVFSNAIYKFCAMAEKKCKQEKKSYFPIVRPSQGRQVWPIGKYWGSLSGVQPWCCGEGSRMQLPTSARQWVCAAVHHLIPLWPCNPLD